MNTLDLQIIKFFNQFSKQSIIFDKIMVSIGYGDLFKGVIILTLIWYLWFRIKEPNRAVLDREHLVATFIGTFFSLFVARVLALALPFRIRPVHNPDIHFTVPYDLNSSMASWSSFPSDHAVLFFMIGTGILFISKKWGWIALIYTATAISFPRVYLGLHYPSDVLAGAVLGCFFAIIFNTEILRIRVSRPIICWSYNFPGVFYSVFFILSYQIATLFNDFRSLAEKAFKMLFFYI